MKEVKINDSVFSKNDIEIYGKVISINGLYVIVKMNIYDESEEFKVPLKDFKNFSDSWDFPNWYFN